VDLSRLFSDVSRTVSGIRTILGAPNQQGPQESPLIGEMPHADVPESESSMPFAGLFGGQNVCFKTCGMEDIQFAARRAGEMFSTMRLCLIILTFVIVVGAVILTSLALYYLYRKHRSLTHMSNLRMRCLKCSASSYNTSASTLHQPVAPPSFSCATGLPPVEERSPPRLIASNANNLVARKFAGTECSQH